MRKRPLLKRKGSLRLANVNGQLRALRRARRRGRARGLRAGATMTAGTDGSAVTLHRDGSHWSVVPTPTPASGQWRNLAAVSAVSGDDVWAVGGTGIPGARRPSGCTARTE